MPNKRKKSGKKPAQSRVSAVSTPVPASNVDKKSLALINIFSQKENSIYQQTELKLDETITVKLPKGIYWILHEVPVEQQNELEAKEDVEVELALSLYLQLLSVYIYQSYYSDEQSLAYMKSFAGFEQLDDNKFFKKILACFPIDEQMQLWYLRGGRLAYQVANGEVNPKRYSTEITQCYEKALALNEKAVVKLSLNQRVKIHYALFENNLFYAYKETAPSLFEQYQKKMLEHKYNELEVLKKLELSKYIVVSFWKFAGSCYFLENDETYFMQEVRRFTPKAISILQQNNNMALEFFSAYGDKDFELPPEGYEIVKINMPRFANAMKYFYDLIKDYLGDELDVLKRNENNCHIKADKLNAIIKRYRLMQELLELSQYTMKFAESSDTDIYQRCQRFKLDCNIDDIKTKLQKYQSQLDALQQPTYSLEDMQAAEQHAAELCAAEKKRPKKRKQKKKTKAKNKAPTQPTKQIETNSKKEYQETTKPKDSVAEQLNKLPHADELLAIAKHIQLGWLCERARKKEDATKQFSLVKKGIKTLKGKLQFSAGERLVALVLKTYLAEYYIFQYRKNKHIKLTTANFSQNHKLYNQLGNFLQNALRLNKEVLESTHQGLNKNSSMELVRSIKTAAEIEINSLQRSLELNDVKEQSLDAKIQQLENQLKQKEKERDEAKQKLGDAWFNKRDTVSLHAVERLELKRQLEELTIYKGCQACQQQKSMTSNLLESHGLYQQAEIKLPLYFLEKLIPFKINEKYLDENKCKCEEFTKRYKEVVDEKKKVTINPDYQRKFTDQEIVNICMAKWFYAFIVGQIYEQQGQNKDAWGYISKAKMSLWRINNNYKDIMQEPSTTSEIATYFKSELGISLAIKPNHLITLESVKKTVDALDNCMTELEVSPSCAP